MEESAGGKKSFFRRWVGVAVLAVIAVVVVVGLLNLGEIIGAVQGRLTAWKYEREIKKLEAPYKNDKYGGQTPEETFDLFLEALRNEDIDLASKYFVIPRQESWKKTLEEYTEKNLLDELVDEFEKNRLEWELVNSDETSARFEYFFMLESQEEELPLGGGETQKIIRPAGKYSSDIIFEKYPSGVWKISLL